MSRPVRSVLVGATLLFLGAFGFARAFDTLPSFTMDLPFQATTETPLWLGHPVIPNTAFATIDVPIQPPDTTSSLLVTVFFDEKPGGFLRIFWQGSQTAQLLTDNFYEGIGMSNQRSLLIPPDVLLGAGMLTLQTGDTTLPVRRLKFQWLENRDSLVSPEIADTLVTPSSGATQSIVAFSGQPEIADLPAWKGRLVNVPITDTPQRIEEGVDFGVELDSVPTAGRITLKENGLPWGKHLVVWINQLRVGTITPTVPDLRDDGFLTDTSTYIGWREGSVFVPSAALKAGPDSVQFSTEDDGTTTPETSPDATPLPLAVKEVVLQLNYPPLPVMVIPPPAPTDLTVPGASAAQITPSSD